MRLWQSGYCSGGIPSRAVPRRAFRPPQDDIALDDDMTLRGALSGEPRRVRSSSLPKDQFSHKLLGDAVP